jgi:hypothetical protein
LTDFNRNRGIQNWDVDSYCEEHKKDLEWLNQEIAKIEREDPERKIIVLTSHSPTIDPRANDPRHRYSDVSSEFVSDLSAEKCWTSVQVRLWAFGNTGKLVVANQGGYNNKIRVSTTPFGRV